MFLLNDVLCIRGETDRQHIMRLEIRLRASKDEQDYYAYNFADQSDQMPIAASFHSEGEIGLLSDFYNSGGRARGSRSLVVAVDGRVTNGPPSSGADLVKATSGISLGRPSNGNSLRNGKNG